MAMEYNKLKPTAKNDTFSHLYGLVLLSSSYYYYMIIRILFCERVTNIQINLAHFNPRSHFFGIK